MIKTVRLKNFRRYRDCTISFQSGMNIIIGENNVGKTTIFYAIEYCLFGNVSGFKTPAALLQPKTKTLGVEITFYGKDHELYKLQRIHQKPPKARSTINGFFTLKHIINNHDNSNNEYNEQYVLSSDFGDTEDKLSLKIFELTGITKRLFEVAIHIRQGELTTILEGTPKVDMVLGLTAAGVSEQELRSYALEFEKEISSLDVLKESLRNLESQKQKNSERNEILSKELSEVTEKVTKLQLIKKSFNTIENDIQDISKDLISYQRSTNELNLHLSKMHDISDQLSTLKSKIGSNEKINEEIKVKELDITNLRAEINHKEKVISDLLLEKQKIDQNVGDIQGRIKRREKTKNWAICEVCGQKIDQEKNNLELNEWNNQLNLLEKEEATNSEKTTALHKEIRIHQEKSTELTRSIADLKHSLDQLTQLETRKNEYSVRLKEFEKNLQNKFLSLEKTIEKYSNALDEINLLPPNKITNLGFNKPLLQEIDDTIQNNNNSAHLSKDCSNIINVYTDYKKEFDRIFTELNSITIQNKTEVSLLSDNKLKIQREIDNNKQFLSQTDQELARINKELQNMQEKEYKAKIMRSLSSGLKEVQEKLHEVVSSQLALETHSIHKFISKNIDEYKKIELDAKKYAIQVLPTDIGQLVPASSYQGGGHKLLLGLSFVIAISKIVNIPFIMLDEPTYGLDITHRENLFSKINELQLCNQILLITHQETDKQLNASANIIDIVKDEHHYSSVHLEEEIMA